MNIFKSSIKYSIKLSSSQHASKVNHDSRVKINYLPVHSSSSEFGNYQKEDVPPELRSPTYSSLSLKTEFNQLPSSSSSSTYSSSKVIIENLYERKKKDSSSFQRKN